MSIISETGQVRTVDTRAVTPFYEITGAEESSAYAERIIDSVWIRGCVPDDAPYIERLRELICTTAQMAAESGYGARYDDINFIFRNSQAKHNFAAIFLAIRGLDNEQEIGRFLNVGSDLWARWTYRERMSLMQIFDRTNTDDDRVIEEIPADAIEYLNASGVIDSGIMRMLRGAVFHGYLWGHGNPQPLIEKIELMSLSDDPRDWVGYYDPQTNRLIKPRPIEDTVYKRSLKIAERVRQREVRLNTFFQGLIS